MRVLVLLFSFAVFVFGVELKIATFNVENLFDGARNGNEYKSFRHSWNEDKYQKKLKVISEQIKELDADLIAVQEIENSTVLASLAKKSGYKFYQFASLDGSPVGLGIMSKIKIDSSGIIKIDGVKTRPILWVNVEFAGQVLRVFTVHFPAKKNGKKALMTSANTLKNALSSKNTIVLGDFNSDFNDYNFVFKNLDGFVNLWKFKDKRWRKSHVSGRAIDQIMLSSDFFDKQALRYKDDSFFVSLPPLKFKNSPENSDHFAIVATIVSKKDNNADLR